MREMVVELTVVWEMVEHDKRMKPISQHPKLEAVNQ